MGFIRLYIFFALLFTIAITGFAQEPKQVEFFVGGKPGGILYDITQELQPYLDKRGYKVNINVTGACDKGQDEFLSSKKPSLMVILNGQTGSLECGKVAPTAKSMVTNVFTAPIMICGKPGKANATLVAQRSKVTIGASSDYPSDMLISLNPNFKYVPYANSGAMMQGFLAGDTDFIVANMIRSTKLIEEKKADCFVVTGNNNVMGAIAATKLYPNWSYNKTTQAVAVVQNNWTVEDLQKLRKDLLEIFQTAEWKTFANNGRMNINTDFSVKEFNDSSKQWVVKK